MDPYPPTKGTGPNPNPNPNPFFHYFHPNPNPNISTIPNLHTCPNPNLHPDPDANLNLNPYPSPSSDVFHLNLSPLRIPDSNPDPFGHHSNPISHCYLPNPNPNPNFHEGNPNPNISSDNYHSLSYGDHDYQLENLGQLGFSCDSSPSSTSSAAAPSALVDAAAGAATIENQQLKSESIDIFNAPGGFEDESIFDSQEITRRYNSYAAATLFEQIDAHAGFLQDLCSSSAVHADEGTCDQQFWQDHHLLACGSNRIIGHSAAPNPATFVFNDPSMNVNISKAEAGLIDAAPNYTTSINVVNAMQSRHVEHCDKQVVSIRVTSSDLRIFDGYFWRKYGEKSIKNKKFTRSYFKCAESACEVTKQAERCSEDPKIVIMTYIGKHNHPAQHF